jgi:predicted Zn finger-like uncharacterized protein
MARFLGVECPNCTSLFAVAHLEGSVSASQPDPMILENVKCPHCGQRYPQFTADVVEFEAEDAPLSAKS